MKISICSLVLVLIIIGCSSVPEGYQEFNLDDLHSKIDEIFDDTLFSHAHWGVLIKSLKSNQLWYERNSDRMFMPASNEKIPTSAAALMKLGPDYKFETIVAHNGEIMDSVICGDLILIGDGDPTLYLKFFDKTTSVFELWADSLLALGINTIDGNIIGDDNKFDDEHLGYGWAFDGLDYWYSAEVGALQINENYVDLLFIPPATENDTLQIIPNLESDYFNIINETVITDTGKNRIRLSREYGTNDIIIRGEILIGSDSFERSPSITNPTKFYVTVLKEVFEKKGIFISGKSIDCDDILNYKDSLITFDTLIIQQSPPLNEILSGLMKRSQNLYAETMVRTLGLNETGIGSFKEGKKVVEEVLDGFGIEPGSHAFKDGSGLSRYNFISPRQIVKILKGMRESKYWDIWYNIQPIAGVDGTLKRRMKGTKAEGNVRAKTGTISNVRGLSGYVTTADGEEVVFSFLVNGHLLASRDTELITDSVLELIAEYPIIKKTHFELVSASDFGLKLQVKILK